MIDEYFGLNKKMRACEVTHNDVSPAFFNRFSRAALEVTITIPMALDLEMVNKFSSFFN